MRSWYFAKSAAVRVVQSATVTAKPAFSAAYCSRLIGVPLLRMPSAFVVIESEAISADFATYPDGAAWASGSVSSTIDAAARPQTPRAAKDLLNIVVPPRITVRKDGVRHKAVSLIRRLAF